MAIDNQFGKGIGLAAGFDLGAQKPLDSRVAVNTIAERDAHITENRAYEGMIVFVDATKKNYQLVNGAWVELFLDEQNRLAALEAQLNGGEGEESSGVLAELEKAIDDVNARLDSNGDIDIRIAQNASDINALEGLVGKAAEGEEDASGLHLAVKNAQDQADKGVADAATEKQRAEGQEAAIRGEMATEAARVDKKIADDIAAESALRVAEEGKLQDAINAINNAENGILAQAKAHAEAKDKEDRDAQLLVDNAQNERIKALEDDKPLKEAAIKAAQDAADAAQADVDAVEKRLDDEGGLVDRLEAAEAFVQGHSHEGLQGEIDAVEGRVDALETFKNGHDHSVMEQGIADNKAAIDKLNGTAEEAGSVAKQIKDAVDPVQGEVDAVEDRVATLEADAPVKQAAIEAAQAAADKAQGEVDAVELRVDAVKEFVEGHSHEGLQGEIDAVELRVDALEAFKNGHSHATMEQGIANNKAAIEKEVDDREAAVEAVQGEIDALEAVVGKAKEGEQPATGLFLAMEQADATNLQAAKDYADQQITALVDSAPDAMNTLNELASAINSNKDIYDAWVVEHNQAMAQQKSDLQAEIDADVKVVADELAKQKDAAQEGTLANQIADEVARADAEEKAIRQLVADEKLALQGEIDADVKAEADRAKAEEADIRADFAVADAALKQELQAEIDADVKVEKERAEGQEAAIRQELANEKAALQKEIDDDVKVVADALANEKDATKAGSLAKQIADEVSAREQADQDLQAAIEALEVAVNGGEGEDKSVTARVADLEAFVEAHDHTTMEGKIDALQEFVQSHSHSTMEANIAANATAIENEVKEGGNRDQAISAALEAYSTTEEVKTILGNVVATLNLSMVNDKMVLKLGGAEGIALSETSLDIVTEADIKAIIAGLDAVGGE